MSLKRKASYPTIASPDDPALTVGLDDTPKHLSSRTRKRYRNDRPSDEVVYENTLRWLFSAQRQQAATPSHDEDTNCEPPPPPETVDPRQHTLFKFFQPSRPSLTHLPSNTGAWKMDDAVVKDSLQGQVKSPDCSVATGTNSPSSQPTDTDMEIDSGSDELAQDPKGWVRWV